MDYLDDLVTAFIDDLLIYSQNAAAEHEIQVKTILKQLCAARLQASIKKYKFYATKTKYLDCILNTDGIEVDPEKTTVIHQ